MANQRAASFGEMRHQVRIETPTQVADGAGGVTTTWALVDSAYAAIEAASRSERVTAQTVSGVATHLVTIRYMAGVTMQARVLFNQRAFGITGIENIDERDEYLRLSCVEIDLAEVEVAPTTVVGSFIQSEFAQ